MSPIDEQIANEFKLQANEAVALCEQLNQGSPVAYLANYRQDITQGLDEQRLSAIKARLIYFNELNDRKKHIIKTIREQNHLTPTLEANILAVVTKTALEDLFLPFKANANSRVEKAKKAGLLNLALRLMEKTPSEPEALAKAFINEEAGITSADEALAEAYELLKSRFTDNVLLVSHLRDYVWRHGVIKSQVKKGKEAKAKKYKPYFDLESPIKGLSPTNALALFRGRREGYLLLSLTVKDLDYCKNKIATENGFVLDHGSKAWLVELLNQSWRQKLLPAIEVDLFNRIKEQAEDKVIGEYAANLKNLLLRPPSGSRITMGVYPCLRAGVKIAICGKHGELLDYTTIYPFTPMNHWHESIGELAKLMIKYHVELIAISQGYASKDVDKLLRALLKTYPDISIETLTVSDAGVDAYKNSLSANTEFPELDELFRAAISIARRTQDPLLELVKIDPATLQMGPNQSECNPIKLQRAFTNTFCQAVAFVGVDINTASVELLRYVPGLTAKQAADIIAYRDAKGPFECLDTLGAVTKLSAESKKHASGFLRIFTGTNPLDRTAVHPEHYSTVEAIAAKQNIEPAALIGNQAVIDTINVNDLTSHELKPITARKILKQLKEADTDPRGSFKTVSFNPEVSSITALTLNMELEGVVSNMTDFGAFVNIGLPHDGLVHISEMTNDFIDDPRKIVNVGDIVKVKVIEVDTKRKRISLSMRLGEEKSVNKKKKDKKPVKQRTKIKAQKKNVKKAKPIINTAMMDAFAKLKR